MQGQGANHENRPTRGRDETMDVTAFRPSFPESARAAFEPSARGARLRRRSVAGAGLCFLVLGFLVTIGLGRVVIALVLALAVAGGALALGRLIHRRRLRLPRPALPRDAVRRAGGLARPRIEGLKRLGDSAGKRASESRLRRRVGRLNAQGAELRRRGDPAAAIESHRAALDLVREVGDTSAEAMTLNNLALALGHAGDEHAAIEHFDEAAVILRSLEDDHHEGQVLANLGLLHGRSGRHEQAVYCLEAALGKLDRGSRAFQRVEEQLRRAS
jgi:tetratricopeptide (TPR) repeat protein